MRVLFCAQDPGGANALLPVIKTLQKKEPIEILAATFALGMFRNQVIASTDCTRLTNSQIEKRIAVFNPDIVLMGTSAGASIEKRLTLIAKKADIPSIAIMDAWINYSMRFSSNGHPHDLRYLPDYICVIDTNMKYEMMREGFPSAHLVVTGNPYLHAYTQLIHRRYKKGQIAFISQPLSVAPYNKLPFTEFEVLTDLLAYPNLTLFNSLLIKLHPKEMPGKFNKLLVQSLPINVQMTTQNVYQLISQSPLIIGMNSTILFEAGLSGGAVISYQPRLAKAHDTLMSNRLGISSGVYDKTQFYQTLNKFTKGTMKKSKRVTVLRKQYTSKRSIENIINLLHEKSNKTN